MGTPHLAGLAVSALLLDTHTIVWAMESGGKLGSNASERITSAVNASDMAFVSAISFWEIALLQRKKRLPFSIPVSVWRRRVLEFGIEEVAPDGETYIRAAELSDFHADPADRILAATALALDATLVTADRKILEWPGSLKRLNARE